MKLDESFWRKYFLVYDNLNMLIPYRDLLQQIIQKAKIKKNDIVLDVGSGTGNLSLLVNNIGARVIGVDSSKEAVDIHKGKYNNAEIFLLDINHKLPFPDESFDKICSNNVIYLLDSNSRIRVFNEFYRLLKHGGIVAVSNIRDGFSPLSIYIDHIKESFKVNGFIKTAKQVIILSIPTLKIFYYNLLIKRFNNSRSDKFITVGEQASLMRLSGFVNISDDLPVYSSQAILNYAYKN